MVDHLSWSPATPRLRPYLRAAGLLTGIGLALVLHPAEPTCAEVLYSLDTRCALRGAASVPCRVEAVNEPGATLYRHTLAGRIHTLRISDQPALFSLQEPGSPSWVPLRNAAVRFSTNTLCLNDTDLCVVNPNYLNSLLQERQDFRGRDLVRVHFAANGRVELLCYDGGCDLIQARREGK
ncbi:MAG: hypothetical protein VKP63_09545 [Cyanobacteriota bacterium]|nr:hypothetical protein [Cyanobacteriota bacterium]